MLNLKYFLSAVVILAVSLTKGSAQDRTNMLGIGASFGGARPVTDIKGSRNSPYGRLFFRYYPAPAAAIEPGIGLTTLEASSGNQFFTSLVQPIDARLLLQPVIEGKFQPYIFAGVGMMFFNPKDRYDQRLPRNAGDEYNRVTPYFPMGFGAEYAIWDNTMFGLSATYNPTATENLDDIKTGTKDNYWNININIFAFLSSIDNDPDKDGLTNDEERQLGTDPLNPDTDGDRLRDGEEVHVYHTDPLKPDTDGDGLTDGDEVIKYHTDPLKPDTDGDGLTDGDEVLRYNTDPLNKDTDGDGLTDGDEVLKYKTDPLNKDTDGDGLTDGDEVLKYHTNPLNPDTDGGGMPDGKEIQLGLNPLDPSDDVPIIKVGERIILEGVNFETARTTLLPNAKTILDEVAASLAAYPTAEVGIHGHTDNIGGAKYNMKLSIGRAEAVKAYLVSKGIPASRITTKGFGFTKPIADNAAPAGRAKNRRIEFVRLK